MFATDPDLAAACGVSPRTVRRWRASGHWPPVARLAAAMLSGDLGALSPDWTGWRVSGDTLTTPDGRTVTPAQVLQADWLARLVDQMADADRRRRAAPVPLSDDQAARLRAALAALDALAPLLADTRAALDPLLAPPTARACAR